MAKKWYEMKEFRVSGTVLEECFNGYWSKVDPCDYTEQEIKTIIRRI